MHLTLIRHTTPDVPKGSSYGFSDVPLAASFEQEREITRRKIADPGSMIFFSSPLQRCVRLAEFLSPEKPPLLDQRLKELNFGIWEMKRWDGAAPEVLMRSLQGVIESPIEGGESYRQLFERAEGFLREIHGTGIERAAVVTHAGVIRSIVASVLRIPLANVFSVHVGLGSVSEVELNGAGGKLIALNR